MLIIISLLNALYWAWLRRTYGGLYDDKQFLGNRGVQTVIMILSMIPMLFYHNCWVGWGIAVIASLWVQFQHWSRAVGCILDSGRNSNPDISKYSRWYKYPLNWIYDGLNKVSQKFNWGIEFKKYQGYYDFWYTEMRYACPLLLLAPISWWYFVVGLCSAPSYYFSWWLFEKHPELYKAPAWYGQPKNLAELIYGFCFGLGFALIRFYAVDLGL